MTTNSHKMSPPDSDLYYIRIGDYFVLYWVVALRSLDFLIHSAVLVSDSFKTFPYVL